MTVEDAVSAQFAPDIPAFAKPTFQRLADEALGAVLRSGCRADH